MGQVLYDNPHLWYLGDVSYYPRNDDLTGIAAYENILDVKQME